MPEVKYRITVDGAAAAKASIQSTNKEIETSTHSATSKAEALGSAFKAVSRDVDTIGGESASVFGRMVDDVLSVGAALGTGGLAGFAAVASLAVGGIVAVYAKWNDETKTQKELADKTAAAEKKWLDDTLAGVNKVNDAMKIKSVEELRSYAIVKDLQLAKIAMDRAEAAMAISRSNNATENARLMVLARQKESEGVKVQSERDIAWQKYGVAQNRALNMEVLVNEREAREERQKIAKQKAQEEYDELRADLKAALALRAADKKKAKEDELADDKRQAAENLAFSEEENKRERIAQAVADQSMATEDLTHKKQELAAAAREQANAENLATQQTGFATAAMYAQSAAMLVAQPIINEMLTSEREMLMLNRDTFEEYRQQDWATLIAAKVQAIMAGIAVEATGKAIMETGEGLAAIATGTGMLMLGMPNGAGMIAAGAGHLAAASAFAGIAGVSAGGAVAVGSQRGAGGMFKTGDEKKKDGMGGAAGSPAFGKGGGGSGGQGGGGPQNTYVQLVMMPGAFLADTRQGIGIVNGMVAAGQQDEFMQRSNDRRP